MTYDHLQADCLYTGISSRPNVRYRVWEAFTFLMYIFSNNNDDNNTNSDNACEM